MLLSIAAILYFSRGTTFSGDEMIIVVASPDFGPGTLLEPHAGHLLLITRLVYSPLLDLFGLDYLPYRILTALSVCLTVGLLFTWLTRRVPRAVALVPCLILLFFGSDHLHTLQGNGFTILFSLSMGLLALLLIERDDIGSDLGASIALCLAVATYAVGLPFVAGVAAAVAIGAGWRRLWVPAVPLTLYLAWSIWARSNAGGGPDGSIHPENLLLVPAWTFQAVTAVLNAISGLSFNFATGDSVELLALAGPALAIAAIAGVGYRLARARCSSGIWVALAVGLALWTMQALVARTGGEVGGRLPDDARYLYPGAVVAVMILAEAARRVDWGRGLMLGLCLAGVAGLGTNLYLLERKGDFYRAQATEFKVNVGVAELGAAGAAGLDTVANRPDAANDGIPGNFAGATGAVFGMIQVPYGRFGYSADEIAGVSPERRQSVDQTLIAALNLGLVQGRGRTAGCRTYRAGPDGTVVAELPAGGAAVRAPSDTTVNLGRFADEAAIPVGGLNGGRFARLEIPPDGGPKVPWKLSALAPRLTVCALP